MSATPQPHPVTPDSSTPCPACDAAVQLATDTVCDELIECGDCGLELVVLSTTPPVLSEAPQTEQDWGE